MIGWLAAAAAAGTLSQQVALHRRTDGVVVEPDALAPGYDALCAAGRELACRWRSWDDQGRVKEDVLRRQVDPACEAGDAEACLLLAWTLGQPVAGRWAPEGAVDPDRALALLRRACDADVARACAELGQVLSEDRLVFEPQPEVAQALRERACAAGDLVACAALGRPTPAPDPVQGCADGVVAACEARLAQVDGPERLAVLERLCRMDDRHCAVLLDARASAPGTLRDGPPSRVFWGEQALLLRWDGRTWTDHARIEVAALSWAGIRAEEARHEWVVLALPDRRLELPDLGCDAVVAAAFALDAAGRPARVLDAAGGPRTSACVDRLALAERPRVRGGKLTVNPALPDDVGPATEIRATLAASSDGLYACVEADGARFRDPWRRTFVRKRDGSVAKAKPAGSSGDPAVDDCLAAWLDATDLGRTDTAATFTAELDLPW